MGLTCAYRRYFCHQLSFPSSYSFILFLRFFTCFLFLTFLCLYIFSFLLSFCCSCLPIAYCSHPIYSVWHLFLIPSFFDLLRLFSLFLFLPLLSQASLLPPWVRHGSGVITPLQFNSLSIVMPWPTLRPDASVDSISPSFQLSDGASNCPLVLHLPEEKVVTCLGSCIWFPVCCLGFYDSVWRSDKFVCPLACVLLRESVFLCVFVVYILYLCLFFSFYGCLYAPFVCVCLWLSVP